MSLYDDCGRVLISASRLKTWLECPLKWKAMYVDEVKLSPTPSLVFGTAIHQALELFHRKLWLHELVSDQEVTTCFCDTLKLEWPDGTELTDDLIVQGAALIKSYIEQYHTEDVVAAELSLSAPLVDANGEDLGGTLVGIIDLVTPTSIVDLKTSSRATDLFDVTVSHSLQLAAYRYLITHASGKDLDQEIRFLLRRKNVLIQSFRPPPRPMDHFLTVCKQYIEFVKSPVVTARPGFLCGETCPAYAACRLHHGLEAA